jgi:hypothetical protein
VACLSSRKILSMAKSLLFFGETMFLKNLSVFQKVYRDNNLVLLKITQLLHLEGLSSRLNKAAMLYLPFAQKEGEP